MSTGQRTFKVKTGNRRVIQVVAEREREDGAWIPLATSPSDVTSVKFYMRLRGGDVLKVDDDASVVEATTTRCVLQYTLTETDTDTAGDYDAEFYAVLTNGEKITVPADEYLLVKVVEALK